MAEENVKLDTREIELPQLDVSKYIGKKVTVVSVTEHKGEFGYYVRVKGEVLETLGSGDNAVDLQPSRIFSLQEDDEGQIGWGKNTQLGEFLAKHKVSHYKDLLGKEIVVQTRLKDGKEYLTF